MARIMIVDDVAAIREIVTAILQKKGHRVMEARSGDEALALAEVRRAHLVITDVNMPNMDGITLIGKLKVIESYKRTPIVVLANASKGAQDENVARATDAGAVGWIPKPFTEEGLVNAVNQVLVDFWVA
jgi:two-component system, chemotaxis family, chemotaxis protein CheY